MLENIKYNLDEKVSPSFLEQMMADKIQNETGFEVFSMNDTEAIKNRKNRHFIVYERRVGEHPDIYIGENMAIYYDMTLVTPEERYEFHRDSVDIIYSLFKEYRDFRISKDFKGELCNQTGFSFIQRFDKNMTCREYIEKYCISS